MAADMVIHVDSGELTQDDYRCLYADAIGSYYYQPGPRGRCPLETAILQCPHTEKATSTPAVGVGEVSWLKATLTGNAGEYIPGPLERVGELLDDSKGLPVPITSELIAEVQKAFTLPNDSIYAVEENTGEHGDRLPHGTPRQGGVRHQLLNGQQAKGPQAGKAC